MIKAEELMIGDWVMYNPNVFNEDEYEPTKECFPTKVNNGEDIDLAIEGCYIPIPLTPEILEKNGFVIKKKWAQMGNFGDSPLIMWHFEDEPILRHFKHELEIHQNDTGKVHIHIPCEYVHQLQHALKLCGINKNIEL